ncbi:MAG TPA: DUF167 domain-containing protein [Burkholderiales bacterium]|nr:DUF167 domain-containing protein [Burkholderiales bacterium]
MFYRYDAGGTLLLQLHVQPNARVTAVVGPHGDALKLKISAPAADNRANVMLVRFLADQFALPAARIAIRRGVGSRRKLVEITAPNAACKELLESWRAL